MSIPYPGVAKRPGSPPRPIVIIGGGFAGAYAAQELQRKLGGESGRVVLLDQRNYFTFFPLLIEAGAGSLEPRHAVVSIRSFVRGGAFRMAEVTAVDPAGRRVHFRPAGEEAGQSLEYEHLVIALGSVTRLPPVPGLTRYAMEMKSMADAVALRDRTIRLLEQADASSDPARRRALLHLIVVGGNFTGAELAGEMQVFMREAARHYPNVRPEECRFTLVERAGRILGALDPELSDYAAQQLRRRGTTVLLNTAATWIGPEGVQLSDGSKLEAHTVIWCAGIAPPPQLASWGLPLDERGYVLTDPDLRVKGRADLWAIGDCAVIGDPAGKPYPATAQHAIQEGRHAAGNILRLLRGDKSVAFEYRMNASLAALGCRTGVAKIGPIKLSGLPAWFLWRTVYLMKMPGLGRKIRVALDWTLDWFFRRDYVQLGVHRTNHKEEHSGSPPL